MHYRQCLGCIQIQVITKSLHNLYDFMYISHSAYTGLHVLCAIIVDNNK